jgi:uncharacterized protein (DUF3820 family)
MATSFLKYLVMFDKKYLLEAIAFEMPFGKYKGQKIADLPDAYFEWFLRKNNEFPKGKIGDMMAIVYQIKLNGLEEILINLKRETYLK